MKPPQSSDAPHSDATPATFAVVRHGGHQYRVAAGDRLIVDRLASAVGDVIGLEPVLLLSDGNGVEVDAASLEGIRVAATVAGHVRGRKIRVFTFKPKKRHRRTLGFRADLTELVVDRFLAKDEPLPEPVEVEEPEIEAPEVEQVQPAGVAAETVEPERAGAAPARRRAPRARAAEPEAAAAGAVAAEAATPVEPEAPARRRRTAAPATAAAVTAEAEASTSPAPSRRARKPAAAAEPEPTGSDEPVAAAPQTGAVSGSEPEPPSGGAAARRRRVERKASPGEDAE
jgi:large subunit ribosomal protein L21